MNFAKHSNLEGQHAFLGASNYHWLNYSEDKISEAYYKYLAKEKGTKLHALAAELITLGIKLPDKPKALNQYVNDAIGFKMKPEVVLYYSPICFGTTDAICFRKEKDKEMLRIHDLKTGGIPAHMEQLRIYAALFCLEYDYNPFDIGIELRIYQGGSINIENPEGDDIIPIMEKIKIGDKILSKIMQEEM